MLGACIEYLDNGDSAFVWHVILPPTYVTISLWETVWVVNFGFPVAKEACLGPKYSWEYKKPGQWFGQNSVV